MEETMKLCWTVTELMHLTRNELCNLSAYILHLLPNFESGSLERSYALISLDNIRRVMVSRGLHY